MKPKGDEPVMLTNVNESASYENPSFVFMFYLKLFLKETSDLHIHDFNE